MKPIQLLMVFFLIFASPGSAVAEADEPCEFGEHPLDRAQREWAQQEIELAQLIVASRAVSQELQKVDGFQSCDESLQTDVQTVLAEYQANKDWMEDRLLETLHWINLMPKYFQYMGEIGFYVNRIQDSLQEHSGGRDHFAMIKACICEKAQQPRN